MVWLEGCKKDGLICDNSSEGLENTPVHAASVDAHRCRVLWAATSGHTGVITSVFKVATVGKTEWHIPQDIRYVPAHVFVGSPSVSCLWSQAVTARTFHGPIFLKVSHPRHLVLLPAAYLVPTSAESHPQSLCSENPLVVVVFIMEHFTKLPFSHP